MVDRPPFPEPSGDAADPAQLTLRHLDHLRGAVVAKLADLPESELRRSRLPSGWSPLELGWHLAHMEQRWFVWGFLAEPVPEPWGDHDPDGGGWAVPDHLDLAAVTAMLARGAARTREVVTSHRWDAVAATGGRFAADPPTLASICFHVVQEYARHAGHLDVVVELAGGHRGE